MANKNLDIIISAIDKATGPIKKIGGDIEGFAERNKRSFQKMAGFGTAGFAAIVGGATAAATSMGKTADRLLDLQDITGLTTDTLQEFEAVTRTAGVDSEAFARAISGLSRRFKNIEKEGSGVNEAMNTLGVSIRDTNGEMKDMDSILMDSLHGLSSVENELERNALANEIFGRSYEDLIPIMALGADGIDEIRKGAHDMGQVMSKEALESANEFRIEQEKLTATMGAVKNSIAVAVIPVLMQLFETVQPIIESTVSWIKENEELTKKIIVGVGIITGLIAVLGTLGLALMPIIATFKSLIITVKAVGAALMFLAANPIGMVIVAIGALVTGIVLLIRNWDKVGPKVEQVGRVILGVFDGITNAFKNIVSVAFDWGKNMMSMLYNGIMSGFRKVRDGVLKVATTIKNFLGFSSPTKEGPNSDSDKWMPNLINMMTQGLDKGVVNVKRAATRVARGIEGGLSELRMDRLKTELSSIQVEATNMSARINQALSGQKNNILGLADEYRKLQAQINQIDLNIDETIEGGRLELAQRAVQIEDELLGIKEREADLQERLNESQSESTRQELQQLEAKKQKLESEMQLAKMHTDDEQLQEARRLGERSQTQILLERIDAKVEEHLAEKERIEELKEAKKAQILDEGEKYKQLVEEKKALDNEYFDLFRERLNQQQAGIRESISMMQRLNAMSGGGGSIEGARELGGPVTAGRSYLVGERGPELFTPASSGRINNNTGGGGNITINMGGVVVNNEADENRLIDKMKRALTNDLQMSKFGIS